MHLLHALLHHYGYLALAGLAFLAAGYLPVPGALAAAAAGGLVGSGYFQLPEALGAIVTGGVFGDCGRYWLARRLTNRRTWNRRDERYQGLRRLDRLLRERPLATIIVSRFVPIARGAADSLSGMSRLGAARFLVADVAGNVIYAGAFLGLGFLFGRGWGDARLAVTIISVIAFLLGAATAVSVVAFPRLTTVRREFRS